MIGPPSHFYFLDFFLEFTPIVKEPTRVSLTIIQIIIHQLSLLIGKFTLKYQWIYSRHISFLILLAHCIRWGWQIFNTIFCSYLRKLEVCAFLINKWEIGLWYFRPPSSLPLPLNTTLASNDIPHYCLLIKEHNFKTEQPATFWLERSEEVHVSIFLSSAKEPNNLMIEWSVSLANYEVSGYLKIN